MNVHMRIAMHLMNRNECCSMPVVLFDRKRRGKGGVMSGNERSYENSYAFDES